MKMLICDEKNCTCSHHRLLNCMENGENDEAKLILQKLGDFSNLADSSGFTLLHYSAKHGNAEISQHLIDNGINVDCQDNAGVTPLMIAVRNEKIATVEVLLKNNADIYLSNSSGVSSLQCAVKRRFDSASLTCLEQNSHIILELLVDKLNRDFLTRKDAIKQLLLQADNPVKLAAVAIARTIVTKFLLANGYAIGYRERTLTALPWAMIFAKTRNIKLLIKCGAGLLFGHYYCQYFARTDEQLEILKFWLKDAANKWPVSDSNRRYLKRDLNDLLKHGNTEIVRTVLKNSSEAAIDYGLNESLLYLLIDNENAHIMDVLEDLDLEFDVNNAVYSSKDYTPLMLAALKGYLEKVEFLLRHGANVNATTPCGMSALHCAVKSTGKVKSENSVKIVELLLHCGADAQLDFSSKRTIIARLHFHVKPDLTKIVLAHFALLRALGQLPLTSITLNQIEFRPTLKSYFGSCVNKLEEMKGIEVYEAVTLFMLLTEKEEKLVVYARNPKFILAFDKIMENTPRLENYYSNTLKYRMAKALDRAGLEKKAILIIEKLTGLCSATRHSVIYSIISFLNLVDLKNLCKI